VTLATSDFYIAPFVIDGQLEGIGGCSLSRLSPKWLAFCREVLDTHGPSFRCSIPLPELEHISVHSTSSKGASLVSFSVRKEPATSAAALSGIDPDADGEVLRMFVDSLRKTPLVRQAAASSLPFEAVFGISERPLYIVIPWANPSISDQDMQLVQELQKHLAGALLTRTVTSQTSL
jgi:hypothetical protein